MRALIESQISSHYLHAVGGQEFVEIDGTTYPVVHDRIRDEFLRSEGYRVFRVPTRSVREKPAVVMHDLKKVLEITE